MSDDGFEPPHAILGAEVKIAIVGSGMGGLASALALAKAGFSDIHVFETAPNLGFVGAGIQVAPNLARILRRLGCWEHVANEAVECGATSIRRGHSNEELGHVDLAYVEREYGVPHMVAHRASLAGALYEGCKTFPDQIHFHFGTSVDEMDFDGPRLRATEKETGQSNWVQADVILAADGVKSQVRGWMLARRGEVDEVMDTGQAAYRIMLTRDQMKHDSELLALIDSNTVVRWIGEKRHIIAYPISSRQIYNISTAHPDANFAAAPSTTYTTRGSKSDMLATFRAPLCPSGDFCPLVQKMLGLVPDGEVVEWKLRVHAPLETWVDANVALVGDACHPTLPHLAQGAAQAIEDAAVLSAVLSRVTHKSEINRALCAYERLRKDRAETLVAMADANGRALQLGEGAAKEERDKQFAALKKGKGPVPDKWADAEVQKMIYAHDCWQVALDQYDEVVQQL